MIGSSWKISSGSRNEQQRDLPMRAQQHERRSRTNHDASEPGDVAADGVRHKKQHHAGRAVNPQHAPHDLLVQRRDDQTDRDDRELADESRQREREDAAVTSDEGDGQADECPRERRCSAPAQSRRPGDRDQEQERRSERAEQRRDDRRAGARATPCRARIARTAASPAVTAQANGARPTIRSPTTNTANHNRATTAGQLSARPIRRPKSAVDAVHAIAVAGTVPSAQPTAGNNTL